MATGPNCRNVVNRNAERLRQLAAAHVGGTLSADEFLQRVCALAADRLGCNRASLWRFESESGRRSLRCLAMHDDQPAASIVGNVLVESEYRDYFAALSETGVFQSADTFADPRLARLRDSYLVPLNVRSLLGVAFNVNGRTFGILCCEQVGDQREWRSHDIAAIRRIGTVVSLASTAQRAGPAWQPTQPVPLIDPPGG
jgi:GAF domain-containing protein